MLLRRRPVPPAVSAADRIAALLAGGRGGWVPPDEWPGQDGAGQDGAGGAVAPWPGSGELDRPQPPPALIVPALDGQDPSDHLPAARPDVPRSAGGAHRLPGLLAVALPATLRTGRLVAARRGILGLVLLGVLAAVVTAAVLMRGRPQEVVVPEVVARGQPMVTQTRPPAGGVAGPPSGEVVVAVAGAVVRPGLVRLPTGSRVADALAAAGGPVPGTDPGLLNLARRLVDGEQVLVGVEPAPGSAAEPASGGAGGSAATGGGAPPGGLVDLNAATTSDLDGLPGIGPVLAQRIVDWRTENDRFGSVEQLREVTGIGEAKFQDLRERVTV